MCRRCSIDTIVGGCEKGKVGGYINVSVVRTSHAPMKEHKMRGGS